MRADGAEAGSPARGGAGKDGQQFGRRLSDLLIAEGHITPDQLAQAVNEQLRTDEKLGAVLVRLGLITEDQLIGVLSRQYKVPIVELPEHPVAVETLRLVPAAVARKYDVLPVGRSASTLTLAMIDPTNLSALDEVSFRTGLRVQPALARPSTLRRHIMQAYESSSESLADVLSLAEAEFAREGTAGRAEGQDLRASADQAPIVRLVNAILEEAIRRGASDIHLDPTETALRVRFRTDGMLVEAMAPPKRIEPAVVSRIKIMAGLDISERRLPQDGRVKFRFHGRDIDFRVSVLPTIFGESVCMRVLDKDALKLDPAALGFDPWALNQFEKAIHSAHGVILITGPTGSGKTTTLYSALQALNSPDVHIVTLEDPVEYNLRGINQVQVREDVGLTFAGALRAFLRHDPDVILVGEMRDTETAQMAIRAALTGHLVLSTLHTNSSPATIARLVDMGLPPFLIASALRIIVAQRLVRKVCLECREASEIDETVLADHGHAPQGLGKVVVYSGKGCASCGFTGMRGRVAIYEVMPMSPEINELILSSGPTTEIRRIAREQGMRTLREAGIQKVLDGVTTVEEILRVTAE